MVTQEFLRPRRIPVRVEARDPRAALEGRRTRTFEAQRLQAGMEQGMKMFRQRALRQGHR